MLSCREAGRPVCMLRWPIVLQPLRGGLYVAHESLDVGLLCDGEHAGQALSYMHVNPFRSKPAQGGALHHCRGQRMNDPVSLAYESGCCLEGHRVYIVLRSRYL